jgi:AhpD family alkylhydroperoxidase
MLDRNADRDQPMAAIGESAKRRPGTVRGKRSLGAAGAGTGRIDARTRTLIALAVAGTRRGDGCIAVDATGTVEAGARREPIAEAHGIDVALHASAAPHHAALVLDAPAGSVRRRGRTDRTDMAVSPRRATQPENSGTPGCI